MDSKEIGSLDVVFHTITCRLLGNNVLNASKACTLSKLPPREDIAHLLPGTIVSGPKRRAIGISSWSKKRAVISDDAID